MALIATDTSQIRDYSLIQEKDSTDKTIFQIGVLDVEVRAYLDDSFSIYNADKTGIDDVSLHRKYLEFVRFGLKGWSNFKDTKGLVQEFKTVEINVPRAGKRTVVSPESMNKLKLSWCIELGMEIARSSTFTEQDSKNS